MDNYLGDDGISLSSQYTLHGQGLDSIWHRLDALMMVLKSCKQDACREPWKILHPDGDVNSLKDALASRFDDFYLEQPKVQFDLCALGYIKEVEGPQEPNIFGAPATDHIELKRQTFEYSGHWSLWT